MTTKDIKKATDELLHETSFKRARTAQKKRDMLTYPMLENFESKLNM